MRAVASAKILAETMKRELKVVWEPEERVCNCRADDLFENIPQIALSLLDTEVNLYYTVVNPAQIQDIERQDDMSKIIHIITCSTLKSGSMRQSEFDSRFRQELQNLQPVPKIQQRVLPDASQMIGLQIRQKDHWPGIRYSPVSLFLQAIDRHIAENSRSRFFLCSDSSFVRKYLKNRYRNKIFFYSNGEISRKTTRGIQAALVDLLTLSKTAVIYGSYFSSFGEVAHQIHRSPLRTLSLANPLEHSPFHSRFLRWDARAERWKMKWFGRWSMKRFPAFAALLRCQFFCSKFYQLYASRYFF